MRVRNFLQYAMCLSAMTAAQSCLAAGKLAPPFTPGEEQTTLQLADKDLLIELVASEPEVISPVALAFDEDGRLFVAEMLDYPNAQTSGRIRLLEDRNGDGNYETATIFADRLPFPNGVLPWKHRVLVTAAPDVWFLSDTNGDGRSDERRMLFTGFGQGNQQLRVNGLMWGLDNWVYGANGRSDGEIRSLEGKPLVSLRGHDFRFRPDTRKFEAIAGRSQFGLARDDWGNRFLSWNTIPIRHEVLPERYLAHNAHLATTESLFNILETGDNGRVFPLAPPPLTFNDESVQHFNALAGLTIFRAGGLGEDYRGNAFVGESLLGLVHRRVLRADGVTFVARRGEQEKEFLASSDPWFHPVNFATGPDGALYVVDFYRRFVEHPDFVHNQNHNDIPWREGAEHGRIWRIRNSKLPFKTVKANLGRAASADLVKHFEHENGWWRDTSQRLLIERQDRSAIPALERLARAGVSPLARVHALYTLDGLGALTASMLLDGLKDLNPGVREHAIRLCETVGASGRSIEAASGQPEFAPALEAAIIALAEDSEARVRFQVALTLGEFKDDQKLDALAQIARRDFMSHWHTLAILSSAGSHAWRLLKNLGQEQPGWLAKQTREQNRLLRELARLTGANHTENELSECLAWLSRLPVQPTAALSLTVFAGLVDGLAGSGRTFRQLLNAPPDALKNQLQPVRELVAVAASHAVSSNEEISTRLNAIRILARATPELSGKPLLDLLQPAVPIEVQSAAALALSDLNDPLLGKQIFSGWRQRAASPRRRVLAVIPRSAAMTEALVEALEQETVSTVELDTALSQTLLKNPSPQLRGRFQKLLAPGISADREAVINRFATSLDLNGSGHSGAAIFTKICSPCHAIQGQGHHVGPDLSGIANRPKKAMMVDILDPSRQVSPDFINYTLLTTDGKFLSGYILSETAASVTLRHAGEADETVLRTQIKELRAESKSLMPEGLEQGLTSQDMADLLSFLGKPEPQWLSDPK